MDDVVIEYDKNRRIKYHPELHPRNGTQWTEDELEYLCKFHKIDTLVDISFALERAEASLAGKLTALRKNGKYEYYRNLNKHY